MSMPPAALTMHDGRLAGAVEDDAEVILFGDVERGRDEDLLDGQPLDVHAQDAAGDLARLCGGLAELDAARLAAPTDVDLRLDDDGDAELGGRWPRPRRRWWRSCPAARARHTGEGCPSPGTRESSLIGYPVRSSAHPREGGRGGSRSGARGRPWPAPPASHAARGPGAHHRMIGAGGGEGQAPGVPGSVGGFGGLDASD